MSRNIKVEDVFGLSLYTPAAQSLGQAYVWNRKVLLLFANLTYGQTLIHWKFKTVWQLAKHYNMEPLLLEIIVRGEILLYNYVAAYWIVGDVREYNLIYYWDLEQLQANRRKVSNQYKSKNRTIQCGDWAIAIATTLSHVWSKYPITI